MIIWDSVTQDGGGWGVYAQRYQQALPCAVRAGQATSKPDDEGRSVATDANGNVYFTGSIYAVGDSTLTSVQANVFVEKYDRLGTLLWRREMIHGSYCPVLLPLHTPQGTVQAVVLTANTAHPHHCGDLSMQATAAIIARACGRIGSNREYLDQLVAQFGVLGIEDPYVHTLAGMVDEACR